MFPLSHSKIAAYWASHRYRYGLTKYLIDERNSHPLFINCHHDENWRFSPTYYDNPNPTVVKQAYNNVYSCAWAARNPHPLMAARRLDKTRIKNMNSRAIEYFVENSHPAVVSYLLKNVKKYELHELAANPHPRMVSYILDNIAKIRRLEGLATNPHPWAVSWVFDTVGTKLGRTRSNPSGRVVKYQIAKGRDFSKRGFDIVQSLWI